MIDRKEVLRYLGYKGQEAMQDVLDLIEVCVQEVEAAAEPKHVMRRLSVYVKEAQVDVYAVAYKDMWEAQARQHNEKAVSPVIRLNSKSLARNLSGCREAVFFAATLGLGVDRLLHKYLKIQVSKAVVIQAVAAAMMEGYCDQCQAALAEECAKEGLVVRPRYSPGYGDLPLTVQQAFLDVLQAQKSIGIMLTEGDIMLPEKSVTAIMGLRGVI